MEALNVVRPGRKVAVVLFNLGGPDSPKAVKPFLFNLFNDPAIIRLPKIFRRPLAALISRKREVTAQKIYEELGGRSPILENTEAQALALEQSLTGHGKVKVFTCMRYWHPMSDEVAKKVKDFAPDQIILLPLYPQYSTTTTASSFKDWHRAAKAIGLNAKTHEVCCYPTHPEFVKGYAQLLRTYYNEAQQHGEPRILFSAHGLPEKIVRDGDPYQWQVEVTTQAILKSLGLEGSDYVNCYQSRVGPMKWLQPTTESEILRAGFEGKPVVLVPISFVSEHSETLVELDIEYAQLAHNNGVDRYYRVPTVSVGAHYIAALADICLKLKEDVTVTSSAGTRICDKGLKECPCRA